MANAYWEIATRYQGAFILLLRFWTTGPSDVQVAEEWYRALFDAGLLKEKIPALGFAIYAEILGVCAGKIGGLLCNPSSEELKNIEQRSDVPLTRGLLPILAHLREEEVFAAAIANIVCGIEVQCAKSRTKRNRRRKIKLVDPADGF